MLDVGFLVVLGVHISCIQDTLHNHTNDMFVQARQRGPQGYKKSVPYRWDTIDCDRPLHPFKFDQKNKRSEAIGKGSRVRPLLRHACSSLFSNMFAWKGFFGPDFNRLERLPTLVRIMHHDMDRGKRSTIAMKPRDLSIYTGERKPQ